jgi:Predicted membrane-associated HD superfamily hydrolase
MLTQRGIVNSSTFTRRDLGRLFTGAILLVAAMTAIFALDLVPHRLDIAVGDVAAEDIVAPRTQSYVSAIQTAAARDAARKTVDNVYDWSPDKAAGIAVAQATAFEDLVKPVDAAFKAGVKPADRVRMLSASLPLLVGPVRQTLADLDADRWKAVRQEASRVLDLTERSQVRDTDVATFQSKLAVQMVLEGSERTLAAAIISPLIEANSSFSADLTNQARQDAADQVADVVVPYALNETIVRHGEKVTPEALEAIVEFGLIDARPDVARLGGWFLLSVLVVGILLGWIWRFRRQLWHRTNALVLIGWSCSGRRCC